MKRIEVFENGVKVYDSEPGAAANPAPDAGGASPSGLYSGGPRVEADFSPGVPQSFPFYHQGGTLELVAAVIPGRGTYGVLTDSLSGPRSRGSEPWNPSASGGRERKAVDAENYPPGSYTYTVEVDQACRLGIQKVQ